MVNADIANIEAYLMRVLPQVNDAEGARKLQHPSETVLGSGPHLLIKSMQTRAADITLIIVSYL